MADFILPVKPVVLPAIGTPVAGVTCQPVFQIGADGVARYRDQDGVVLPFPGGASHSTVLSTCPATGPTTAPAAEGHYYWTSTLGEKWCWIYGDSAPFVTGDLYGFDHDTGVTPLPHNSIIAVDTFTAPRAGVLTITAIGHFRVSGGGTMTTRGIYVYMNGAFDPLRSETQHEVIPVQDSDVTGMTVLRLPVVAGDIITLRANQFSSTSATNQLDRARLSVQYVK
jgi:hypothetical protein